MKRILFAVLIYFFYCVSVSASATPYFEGNTVSPLLLDRPSSVDSKEKIDEIAQIIELQKNLTQEEINEAAMEYVLTPESIIQAVDDRLIRRNYKHLYRLIDRTEETALNVKDAVKDYWKAPRPYQVNKDIKILVNPSHNNSYPSGHVTKAYTMAYVLGMLMPDKREKFILIAEKIAYRRVITGEHFPSDLRAGRRLALIIIGGLIQNSQFQQDLSQAKKELELNPPHPIVKN